MKKIIDAERVGVSADGQRLYLEFHGSDRISKNMIINVGMSVENIPIFLKLLFSTFKPEFRKEMLKRLGEVKK